MERENAEIMEAALEREVQRQAVDAESMAAFGYPGWEKHVSVVRLSVDVVPSRPIEVGARVHIHIWMLMIRS
jgi:hypothetical protein